MGQLLPSVFWPFKRRVRSLSEGVGEDFPAEPLRIRTVPGAHGEKHQLRLTYLIDFSDPRLHVSAGPAKIAVAVERFARTRIAAGDQLVMTDGPTLLLFLSEPDRRVADLKCTLMLADLQAQLFGQRTPGLVAAYVQIKLEGTIQLERLAWDAIEEAGAGPVTPKALEAPAHGAANPRASDLTCQAGPKTGGVSTDWSPIDHGGGFSEWNRIAVHFSPVWDAQKNAIAIFSACPSCSGRDPTSAFSESQLAELDERLLRVAVHQLASRSASGESCYVEVPVHLSTLITPKHRKRYIAKLAAIRETNSGLANYLIFELINITAGITAISAFTALSAVRPYCRQVHARVNLEFDDFHALTGSGVDAVGADLSEREDCDEALIEALSAFARRAAHSNLAHYWTGVKSRATCVAGLANGARFISGSSVHPLIDRPIQPFKFSLADIYKARKSP